MKRFYKKYGWKPKNLDIKKNLQNIYNISNQNLYVSKQQT